MSPSSSTARFTPRIPTEILLSIFRTAAGDAVSPEYVPFSRNTTPAGLSVKLAIILVCKRWRAVGAQFLYEDIRITPRHFDSLLEILDRTGEFESKPNGHYVRRLIFTTTRVDMDAAVLKCCPYVETLIKPPMSMYDMYNDTPIVSFPFPDRTITTFESVQRIKWSFFSEQRPNTRVVHDSLSFFWHLVQITPGLQYLSLVCSTNVTCYFDPAFFSDLDPYFLGLRVLHVENMIDRVWDLPSLTHLVTSDVELCRALRPPAVELGSRINAVDQFLRLCPDLQEISYLVSSNPPARNISDDAPLASNIQCVRLGVPVGNSQLKPEFVSWVSTHIARWCGPRFPSLRRCILHCGRPILPRVVKTTVAWEEALSARGCTLEWAG